MRREQTEVAALRAHVEELEAARANAPTAPDQTIRKAVTVLFGLLVEQVGRGGAADLLHDNLNNRERAALAGVVTDTSLRICSPTTAVIEAVLKRAGVEFIDENGGCRREICTASISWSSTMRYWPFAASYPRAVSSRVTAMSGSG